jgi:hypothetical protein
LHRLEGLTDAEYGRLRSYAEPVVTNTRGETVGELRVEFMTLAGGGPR